jgi:hypothetical protein
MSDIFKEIRNSNEKKVKILIDSGIKLYNLDPLTGETPLVLALENNEFNIVSMLLDAGASPDTIINETNEYLITEYSKRHDIDVVEYLLNKGANPNLKNINNQNAINCATHPDNRVSIIEEELWSILLDNGANPNIKDKLGNNAFDNSDFNKFYILYKLKTLQSKQRLEFAKMLIDPKFDEFSQDIIIKIIKLIKISKNIKVDELLDKDKLLKKSFKEELQKELKIEIEKSLKKKFSGTKIDGDNMIKIYQTDLKKPNLTKKTRKMLKKYKRSRKNKLNIPLGSSDLSSSRKSRSSPSEDLRDAIKMSVREAKSNKTSSRKSRSLRSSEELEKALKMSIQEAKSGSKKKYRYNKKYRSKKN